MEYTYISGIDLRGVGSQCIRKLTFSISLCILFCVCPRAFFIYLNYCTPTTFHLSIVKGTFKNGQNKVHNHSDGKVRTSWWNQIPRDSCHSWVCSNLFLFHPVMEYISHISFSFPSYMYWVSTSWTVFFWASEKAEIEYIEYSTLGIHITVGNIGLKESNMGICWGEKPGVMFSIFLDLIFRTPDFAFADCDSCSPGLSL